jgi:hypothetical protein
MKSELYTLIRFMTHVSQGERAGDCWLWIGNRPGGRYGHFSVGGKVTKAHRWIYERLVGPIDDGLVLRHKCDHPACVNPLHLEPGTPSMNTRDSVERGRWSSRKGERHPLSILTEPEVRKIRELAASGLTQSAIADRFEISRQQIGKIVRGDNWGHIK